MGKPGDRKWKYVKYEEVGRGFEEGGFMTARDLDAPARAVTGAAVRNRHCNCTILQFAIDVVGEIARSDMIGLKWRQEARRKRHWCVVETWQHTRDGLLHLDRD